MQIITTNASGSDELIGIDNIAVSAANVNGAGIHIRDIQGAAHGYGVLEESLG